MPAYSFKEQFVPMVQDGSKPHTIRAFRKHPVKEGDKMCFFYGMRTKFCTRIRPDDTIKKVLCIAIHSDGSVMLLHSNWLTPELREAAKRKEWKKMNPIALEPIVGAAKDELAWRDGFRHPNDPQKREGCFDMMVGFWKNTHALPFVGNIIHYIN